MKWISHRGNTSGKEPNENDPLLITQVIDAGYDVEVDVWYQDYSFYLGHDYPIYKVGVDFLKSPQIWAHAKSLVTLQKLSEEKDIHYYYHQSDKATITSKGYVWLHPYEIPILSCIIVLPELWLAEIPECLGICSDFVETYRNIIKV